MKRTIVIVLIWTSAVLLAAFIRLNGLADRPVHADEATGAKILADYMEGKNGAFDPKHFHGPVQPYLASIVARIFGQNSWTNLEILPLRLLPALLGTVMVLVPFFLRKRIGNLAALASGGLLATSPFLVYYNRMFIHETLLCLFALVCIPFLIRFIESPSRLSGFFIGTLAALMWATKETAVIVWFSWASAALVVIALNGTILSPYGLKTWILSRLKPLLIGLGAFCVTAVCLFTDFLRYPRGILDGLKTFFVYTPEAGHDKPFLYYMDLLLIPKAVGSTVFFEGALVLVGIAIFIKSFLRPAGKSLLRSRSTVLFAFVATSAAVQVIVYSIIAYKTPWLMLVPVATACLAVPALISASAEKLSGKTPLFAWIAILGVVLFQLAQAGPISAKMSIHPRNPYAYVPTLASVSQLSALLADLRAGQGINPDPTAVVGHHYWPLPWYLRGSSSVGYFDELPHAIADWPTIICLPDQFESAERTLSETHVGLPYGLRSDYPIVLYVKEEVWRRYIENNDD